MFTAVQKRMPPVGKKSELAFQQRAFGHFFPLGACKINQNHSIHQTFLQEREVCHVSEN